MWCIFAVTHYTQIPHIRSERHVLLGVCGLTKAQTQRVMPKPQARHLGWGFHATTPRRNGFVFRSGVVAWRDTKSAPFRKTRRIRWYEIQTAPIILRIVPDCSVWVGICPMAGGRLGACASSGSRPQNLPSLRDLEGLRTDRPHWRNVQTAPTILEKTHFAWRLYLAQKPKRNLSCRSRRRGIWVAGF